VSSGTMGTQREPFSIRAAALFVACALTSGCGTRPDGTPERIGTASSAIQGGTVDMTDGYAVGVCGTQTDPGTCVVICSGVLLAPNLVATARHCVDSVSSSVVDCTGDTFGGLLAPASQYWITTDYQLDQPSLGWHQVKDVVVPQATSFCGNDLALLVLEDNVPASQASPATPEVQYPMTDPSVVSGSETAIGYGDTSPNEDTYGTRHARQNIPILCIPGDAESPCAPVSQSNIADNEFAAGDGPCDGDSGSGSFEQNNYDEGKALALGVLSRGGVMGDSCSGSVYTRFDTWAPLIIQTVTTAAAEGNYPLPAWTAPGPPLDAGTDADAAPDASCDAEGDCTAAQAPPPLVTHGGKGCSVEPGPSGAESLPLLLAFSTLCGARRRKGRKSAGRASPRQGLRHRTW
jgi:hypothetical protein